ncbi:MAG: hypothetical protein M1444_03210 [Patescibacteria group bacterium]|nr:hypothetical protein [Patescibacteria group bacterium]
MENESGERDGVENGFSNKKEVNLVALGNWVKERPFLRAFNQRKARKRIANEIKRDVASKNIPLDIKREYVMRKSERTFQRLNGIMGNGNRLVLDRIDSVRKNPFRIEIVRGNGFWLAREVRPDNTLISEAKIGLDGSTELTLQFTDPEYLRRNANPSLDHKKDLSYASVKTFNLLVGSYLGRYIKGHSKRG